MSEPLKIPVRIIRRRFPTPFRMAVSVKSLVAVTYSTRDLAPETVQFFNDTYSLEIEQAEITKRVKERLGITDTEIQIEFTER